MVLTHRITIATRRKRTFLTSVEEWSERRSGFTRSVVEVNGSWWMELVKLYIRIHTGTESTVRWNGQGRGEWMDLQGR